MQRAFVECHADGHQWKHQGFVGAPDWRPPLGMHGAIARHSICNSCGMERGRWYTRSGDVQNTYRPAEGYYHKRQTPDDVAPTRREYRQELVHSLFAEFEQSVGRAPRKSAARRAQRAS
jgi:hypothetical protein